MSRAASPPTSARHTTFSQYAFFRPRWRLAAALLLALLALGAGPTTSALSWAYEPTPAEILRMSSLAFRGEVLEARSLPLLTSQPDGVLYTEVTLAVHRAYRGTRDGAIVTLRHVGGQLVTGEGMGIAGVPWLQRGEHVAIFANDTVHPFFGTLYADLGLKRFVEHGGQTVALSAHHTPLLADPLERPNPRDVECVPSERQPSLCDSWVTSDGEPVSDPGPGLLTAEAFDAWVLGNLGTAPSGPAQTLTDDASFRAALADWFARIDAPAADPYAR